MDTDFIKKRVKKNSFKMWANNLGRAVIGGSATAITSHFVLPDVLFDWKDVVKLAGVAAIIKGAMYLEKSPLPSMGDEEDETTTKDNENKTTPPTNS